MREITVFLLVLGFCAVVLPGGPAAMAGDTVGFINLGRLVNESEVGRSAIREYQELRQKKERDIAQKQREYSDLRQHIDQNAAAWNEAERVEKLELLKRITRDYERMVANARKDLENEDKDLINSVMRRAEKVLTQVAEKRGYKIILKDPKVLGYMNSEVDVTNDVIKELNRQYEKQKK